MREVVVSNQGAVLQEFGGLWTGGDVGHDLVVFAVHHQGRDGDFLEVLGEVGLRERHDAVVVGLGAAHHALAPPVGNGGFDRFDTGAVKTVEGARGQIAVELGAVRCQLGLQIVEHALGQAFWIRLRLHHQRRHRGDERGFGCALFTVAAQEPGNFAAAGGVSDVYDVVQVEVFDDGEQVVGVVVGVVAVGGLA